MRARYPKVHWFSLRDRIDKRFIISQPPLRIVTTAGVTAGVDGALRFVSEWMGEPVAEAVREFIEWPLQLAISTSAIAMHERVREQPSNPHPSFAQSLPP